MLRIRLSVVSPSLPSQETSKVRDPDHYLPLATIEKRTPARPSRRRVAVERLPGGCLLYRLNGARLPTNEMGKETDVQGSAQERIVPVESRATGCTTRITAKEAVTDAETPRS